MVAKIILRCREDFTQICGSKRHIRITRNVGEKIAGWNSIRKELMRSMIWKFNRDHMASSEVQNEEVKQHTVIFEFRFLLILLYNFRCIAKKQITITVKQ